ncbi:MAG: hypothetical protein QW318_07720 [Candidatus Caldarchaeum sp.]
MTYEEWFAETIHYCVSSKYYEHCDFYITKADLKSDRFYFYDRVYIGRFIKEGYGRIINYLPEDIVSSDTMYVYMRLSDKFRALLELSK